MSSGGMVFSAISRSAITGFLSFSGSMVMCEPLAIARARWAASSTSSNRLGTLSTQSSTVTRAMRSIPLEMMRLCAEHKRLRKPCSDAALSSLPRPCRMLDACENQGLRPRSPRRRREPMPREQACSVPAHAEHGMAPVAARPRSKRHEHEGAPVHLGMRQNEPAAPAPRAAASRCAGRHSRACRGRAAAAPNARPGAGRRALEALERAQQRGRRQALPAHAENHVEVAGLAARSHGGVSNRCRDANEVQTDVAQFRHRRC